jgi:hypothetical protein
MTSHGFVPWDDQHHISCPPPMACTTAAGFCQRQQHAACRPHQTSKTFRTEEILEIPNSSGNHSSPFITENSEYIVAGTRFSLSDGRPLQSRRAHRHLQAKLQEAPPQHQHQSRKRPKMKSPSRSCCPASTSTSAAPARASPTTGCSSPATTPNSPTPCSK